MRSIKPKDENDLEPPSDPNGVPKAPKLSNKRKCISSACVPCRKRKSKCDGATPFCSTCTAVYHTECAYDVDSDHRRKAALKRDIQTLREQNGALGVIIASIKTSPESDVSEIIQQLRADEDLETIADSLKRNVTLSGSADVKSVEGALSNMIGSSSTDEKGITRHFGHTSNLGLVSSQEQPAPLEQQPIEEWTAVTNDSDLIRELMELYFCWSHPYNGLFSKPAFLADMAAGRNKYCSPLLVNTVLALACHYSDRPELRRVPDDPSTAGDYFFEEAKRLLNRNECSSLTQVQSLALMGLREPSCGRDSSGFQYSGRAARMALELGLHLKFETDSQRSPTELEVRRITFWGLFITETVWAICIGRPSHLPTAAINLEKLTVLEQLDIQPWTPYSEYGVEGIAGTQQPIVCYTLQNHLITLSEIVSDTVFMFYAPRERFTSRKLIEFYKRYTRWYTNLPPALQVQRVTLPHILVLHMYYHCVVIHLFRPFLKVDLVRSELSPREICTSSANTIANLLATYREIYGLRRSTIVLSHITLTSAIIDLINLPDGTASYNLQLHLTAMREGAANHKFNDRALHILLALSKQWNIELPTEVRLAAYGPTGNLPAGSVHGSSNQTAWSPVSSSTSSYTQSHEQYIPKLAQEHYIPKPSPPEMSFYTASDSPRPPGPANDLFWSPFPDQGLPLQAAQYNSPMDISAMVDLQGGSWDQLTRDGFKMANNGDTVLGPLSYMGTGHMNGHWPQG